MEMKYINPLAELNDKQIVCQGEEAYRDGIT